MPRFALGPGRSRIAPAAAALVCALLAAFWSSSASDPLAWAWDETMHAGAPAWRMSIALGACDPRAWFDALHDCERYPFVFPFALSLFTSVFGAGQDAALVFSTCVYCAALWGVFLVARELDDGAWTPWIALVLAAASPLALSFAGTLMLELPFLCVSAFALRAWLRRDVANPSLARGRDLAAGAWFAAAFFTKFNYGLLLGVAFALDTLVSEIAARRRGEQRWFARRSAWFALIPALALLWWFALPLPFGLARAAEHRVAFADWIAGNQDGAAVDWKRRALNLAASFAFNPRALLVVIAGAVVALTAIKKPRVRALAIVVAVFAVAILRHPFHLPRFLIPLGAALWPLAAFGWNSVLPRKFVARVAASASVILAVAIAPGADTKRLADALGFLSADANAREYQLGVLASQRALGPSRSVQRAGLARGAVGEFLDIATRAVDPRERVAWLDVTEEISPAGLQHGLWQRGGAAARALEQLGETTHVSIGGVDPKWSDVELAQFVERFDVVLFTEPHSLKARADREFFGEYVARLERAGWRRELAGEVAFPRPSGEPVRARVFTLRRG